MNEFLGLVLVRCSIPPTTRTGAASRRLACWQTPTRWRASVSHWAGLRITWFATVPENRLILSGTPANRAIHLTWDVSPTPPPTATWRIEYYSQTVASTVVATDSLPYTTRAYTLRGLTNHTLYTVTLSAMSGTAVLMSDWVTVTPTGCFVYLPLILK
jgi:hypothetical protein